MAIFWWLSIPELFVGKSDNQFTNIYVPIAHFHDLIKQDHNVKEVKGKIFLFTAAFTCFKYVRFAIPKNQLTDSLFSKKPRLSLNLSPNHSNKEKILSQISLNNIQNKPVSGHLASLPSYHVQEAPYFLNNSWCKWERNIKNGIPSAWKQTAGPKTELPKTIDTDHKNLFPLKFSECPTIPDLSASTPINYMLDPSIQIPTLSSSSKNSNHLLSSISKNPEPLPQLSDFTPSFTQTKDPKSSSFIAGKFFDGELSWESAIDELESNGYVIPKFF